MTHWTTIAALVWACRGKDAPTGADTGADADADADVDTDTDADTDTDTEVGCTVFPDADPWNRDITDFLVHADSDAFIDTMGRNRSLQIGLGATTADGALGIPYVIVPDSQPEVSVSFLYFAESDPGPYPIPASAPVEGGPASVGDRRTIAVDLDNCVLYELFEAWPVDGGLSWRASAGAIFDLTTSAARPVGWRSADASGLPIYPGLVRYDELIERGSVDHALRVTVSDSQMAFISPATDYASTHLDPDAPPMGLRLRMRADYDCSALSAEVQVLCAAFKTHGLLVSDEGEDWMLVGAPDARWPEGVLSDLGLITGSAFEAIYTGDFVVP